MSKSLTCYYDMHVSPPTFDIVSFLMRCKRELLSRGMDRAHVVMLPGPVGGFRQDHLWPYSIEERRAMLDKVAMPICRLLPDCVDVAAMPDRSIRVEPSIGFASPLYGLAEFVKHYRDGIRPLRATELTDFDDRLVTITLREADHWPHRNSRIDQWTAAATVIEKMGFRVVFVRETSKARSPIDWFVIDPVSSLDIAARAKLYATANLNMGVSNGPMWMALAMDTPVMMFRPVDNHYGRAFGDAHFENSGIVPGQQIPGSPDYQELVWSDDDADAIVAAFERFMTRTKQLEVA